MTGGLTCQSTRTHNSRRRLRRKCWWAGHLYVMPQAVVFAMPLQTSLCDEHRASCMRFEVARTWRSFAGAVNRRRFGAVPYRTPAVASRPVVTLGQAAGSAAGLRRRQLLLPSRLPSVLRVYRRLAAWLASLLPLGSECRYPSAVGSGHAHA